MVFTAFLICIAGLLGSLGPCDRLRMQGEEQAARGAGGARVERARRALPSITFCRSAAPHV